MDGNEKSRVQVALRIRPTLKVDKSTGKTVVRADGSQTVTVEESERGTSKRSFRFDHVFHGSQAEVYEAIGQRMLEEAYKGFNVCLFAYGQTGSGKTYSLLGDVDDEERRGIVPRFARCLFDEAQRMVEEDPDLTIKVTLSMVEVYMEKVRDLLAPRQRGQEPESLEVHEDSNRRVYVKGAGVHQVLGYDRMVQLLKKGNANRQTAETKMNETSSRSHAILQIGISQEYQSIERKDLECIVSLVDLAGSERQTKTDSTGQQFEEAKKINHSLMMLGRALNSFSERKGGDAFIPLRESKLTRLLSESFGGNSKTWMLATVSPTASNLTESISTLEYARNAMAITNKVRVNNAFKRLQVKELKSVVAHLERELESLAATRDEKERYLAQLQEEKDALRMALESAGSLQSTRSRLQSSLNAVLLGNLALRRRVEAASHGLVWPLDNEASFLFFKGRCGVSLESVLQGKACSFTLGLQTENAVPTSASLVIQLFPLDEVVLPEPTEDDGLDVVGRELAFGLHVVGAQGIPSAFSRHVFCKFTLLYDTENRHFTTPTVENTTHPHWGVVRQFHIVNVTAEVVACFRSQPLFTFEVFGFST